MDTVSAPASSVNSPMLRPTSPSPSVSPSLALGACPSLDRSVSTPSTSSTVSSRSTSYSSEAGHPSTRRIGYVRPQGSSFADSARARDSVMSLGSIAHMQYYFARTGLLDGKGAQLSRDKKTNKALAMQSFNDVSVYLASDDDIESTKIEFDDGDWTSSAEPVMLPPTVSTYRFKETFVQPLPDLLVLRRQLREALDDAQKLLEETREAHNRGDDTQDRGMTPEPPEGSDSQGWHEIQGLHILDIVTLAIRAAKTYYTAHAHPQKLYAIRSERRIRSDLYQVLDLLKRMAARNFRGGIKDEEQTGIITWIQTIDDLLSEEGQQELKEEAIKKQWVWREGDWEGREREREWLFLKSFDQTAEALPEWTEPLSSEPTDFLLSLKTGLRLVHMHNEMVRRSKRPFGEIKTFYTDLAKPYRCAENLRFWAKAAELRWETKLSVDVLDIVNEKSGAAWQMFDQALLKWCRGVMLIEAGENNLNNPWVYRPGIYPKNMKLDSKTASFYYSRPSEWLGGRRAIVPCAHILGGGSSINFMMYTRASASDYDDFQAKGWTTKELIPLMKKHETYQRASNNRDIHGFEGPIKVSFGNYTYPICQDFLRAVESQDIPVTDDLQDLVTGHGAEHWLKWINRDTGRRSDSAHGYIHSTRAVHQNLHLVVNTKVEKVILEGDRAVGVKVVPTKPLSPAQDVSRVYKARKQIIVSGGTLSSPLILQRSGIGDPEKLRGAGVKPLVDLPGVGLNFQDHYLHFATYRAKPHVESFDDFVRGDEAVQKKVYEQWNINGTGPLATNGIDAGVKVRPTEEELKQMDSWPCPEFRSGWDSYFKNAPDKPFHFLEYPFSRGFTHITSPSAYDAPDFDAGFMNDKRDMAPMVWGYIKSRETARRMDAYAGEVQSMHPFYAFDSPARALDMDLATTNAYAGPNHITAGIQHGSWSMPLEKGKAPSPSWLNSNKQEIREDLSYSNEDIAHIIEEGNSIVKHGVLDERLNVHGVRNLKVADLSICPDNVGCNTYSTALLIGEKCAVLTGEDLGYSGSALDMKVPTYHAPREISGLSRL
ncbi:hypothetical protein MBLNU459_g1470t1 [Dothideomycetes sp. NU459]